MLLRYVFFELYSCIKVKNVLTHSFNTKVIDKYIPKIRRRTLVCTLISSLCVWISPGNCCTKFQGTLLCDFKTVLDLKLKQHFKNFFLVCRVYCWGSKRVFFLNTKELTKTELTKWVTSYGLRVIKQFQT